MSNDYKWKCIGQRHAKLKAFTLNFFFIIISKSGKPVMFKIQCALEVFDKGNQQIKLKVLSKIKNVENVYCST